MLHQFCLHCVTTASTAPVLPPLHHSCRLLMVTDSLADRQQQWTSAGSWPG